MILLIAAITSPALFADEPKQPQTPTEIIIQPDSEYWSKRPRTPAYSPLYALVSDTQIAIYSRVDGQGEVIVASATGSIIADQVADLAAGLIVDLPDGCAGVTIKVIFNGITYSATL